jgi:hypothetical protein
MLTKTERTPVHRVVVLAFLRMVISAAMASNTAKGKAFQNRARAALEALLGETLDAEVPIPIGIPPRSHKFDIASRDRTIVCECKAFAWTTGGNIPSAKITTLREAATYMNGLARGTQVLLIMQRDLHPIRQETLADYFVRLNNHLIASLCVMELDDQNVLRTVCGTMQKRATTAE